MSGSSEEEVDLSKIKRTTLGAAKRLKKNPMYQAVSAEAGVHFNFVPWSL